MPVITTDGGGESASVDVAENSTVVTDVDATDADLDTLDILRFRAVLTLGCLQSTVLPVSSPSIRHRNLKRQGIWMATMSMKLTVQVSDGEAGTIRR